MPTVCLEKSTPKNNIARKEYNKLIGELNNEIDRLSTQNKSLIEKLAITEDQITVGRRNERDLENHNKALVEELCQLSKVNLTLKDERRHEIDLIEEETKRLRIQLDDAVRLKMEAEKEIQKLNMERENLERNLSDAQKKCHTMDTSERDMRNLILRAEEDKKRLAQRIEKLTANERALVLELERLKRHGGTSDGRTKRISQLDEFISGIEADRDYWRGQVEILQQMLNYPSLTSGTEGSGIGRTTTSSRLKSKPPTGQHTTTPSKLGGSLKDAKQRKLEQQVQELRVERDLLRQELDSITRSRHRSPSPVTRSRSLNRFQTRDDYMELTKLRQERDELRSLLNKLEHRVQEIQRNVHTLTQERDQINKLYNDSRSEIHRLHQDLYAMHETGDRNTQTTQTVLRRVESERDRALVDLSRVTAERDSLITKYKNCTENAHADKLRLTNQLDHLENSLNQVAEERDEVIRRVSMHRLRIDELQQRQQQLEDSLAERQELLKKVNEESAQLKQEAELQNNRLEERELQISQLNERTRVMEMDCRRLHERVDEYDMKLRKERDECSLLRSQLQNMEEEKVKLQCDFDNLICERDDLVKHQRQIEKRAQINLSERDRLSRQVNDLNDLKESLEKQLRQLEKDYSDQTTKYQLEREANEKLQQRIDTAIHNKNSIDRRANWLEQQTEELRSHIDQLEQQLSTQKDENKWMSETNEKLTADNESLRATVELANKDKVHLESCIEEMSSAHRQSLREREDLVQRSNGLHERNIELDAENKKLDLEVKRNAEALRAERNTIADLQQQLELCRRRSETAERDANDWSSRVRLAEDQLHKSETRVVQLERELRVERDDYSQLRSRMEMLEEEKQNLEINLKETSQRLSHTEVDLSSRLREIHDIRSAHEEALRTNTRTQEALSTRNNELTAARTELNSIQTSLSETRRLLESEQRETSRLREDLNHMARESQTLQTELQDVGDERDELKQRMKDYLNELSRLERVLSERDSECSKLMDQLRTANEESESWRTRWETAENKLTSCKVDLEDKEGELSNERERSDLKDREISHLRATLNSTEIQNNATSRSLVEANEQLRMSRAEIETLSTEISRIRDALSRSETEKANVQRENNTQRLDNDQLRAQLDDFEVELEQIKEQLEDERENNRNINEILTITRQKEQKALSEAQERTTEVIALRDRITSAEERAEMAQREVEKVRERLAETEREANRLSRSLSAERFEKERALSELRLSSLPAGYRPSGYSSLGATYYPGTSVSRDRTAYQERDDY
ncbi:unnamed protein product [Schistosoma margrebowiei]|uniref:Myosin_tail_1 domain-containing protein n=3 Tax=Schistosoma margrebowiei TaxID=48269 RepID=A0AA85A0Q3_9TREM|nr:unnamed protein product [Schistosoma margrebowiei]